MKVKPFKINVPDSVLIDLYERLGRTRWPKEVPRSGSWNYGTDMTYLKGLVDYQVNQK